jgi:hypothetical protein
MVTDVRAVRRAALVAAILAAGVATEAQARFEGTIALFGGNKWLSSVDWAPVESQPELGVLLDFAQERSPVRLAIDVLASRARGDAMDPTLGSVRVTGQTVEYALGVRKIWGRRLFRPHLGAGGSLVVATQDRASATQSRDRTDSGVGLWVQAGFAFRLPARVELGLDVRYGKANVNFGRGFEDLERSAGGLHAGLTVGYGW